MSSHGALSTGEDYSSWPSVFISILAHNQGVMLPTFLRGIEMQDYPRNRIFLHIQSDGNADNTSELLQEWVNKVGHSYMGTDVYLPSANVTNVPAGWCVCVCMGTSSTRFSLRKPRAGSSLSSVNGDPTAGQIFDIGMFQRYLVLVTWRS